MRPWLDLHRRLDTGGAAGRHQRNRCIRSRRCRDGCDQAAHRVAWYAEVPTRPSGRQLRTLPVRERGVGTNAEHCTPCSQRVECASHQDRPSGITDVAVRRRTQSTPRASNPSVVRSETLNRLDRASIPPRIFLGGTQRLLPRRFNVLHTIANRPRPGACIHCSLGLFVIGAPSAGAPGSL